MADDRIADLDALHARANRLDPPGVLVTHDVRKGDVDISTPHALDDVEICAAHTGPADPHDDVGRFRDLRLGHSLIRNEVRLCQALVIAVEHRCLHCHLPFVFRSVEP